MSVKVIYLTARLTSNDTPAVEPLSISNCPSNCQNDTPNCIVYEELGILPLEIRVKLRIISYWCKLVNNETKLSSSLYRLLLCLKNQGQNNFKWINYVESILNRAGLGYIFINQVGYCDKTYLNQILTDQFVSSWYNDIEHSSRGQFYGSFKKRL